MFFATIICVSHASMGGTGRHVVFTWRGLYSYLEPRQVIVQIANPKYLLA